MPHTWIFPEHRRWFQANLKHQIFEQFNQTHLTDVGQSLNSLSIWMRMCLFYCNPTSPLERACTHWYTTTPCQQWLLHYWYKCRLYYMMNSTRLSTQFLSQNCICFTIVRSEHIFFQICLHHVKDESHVTLDQSLTQITMMPSYLHILLDSATYTSNISLCAMQLQFWDAPP